ncbi:hypothetical protein GGI21_006151 [Coemansia aciculifera]|nr:hypothetical protein GGI21_006151 [Coemansia aciculifera]
MAGMSMQTNLALQHGIGGPIAGLGFGLPMARLYAGYFGGSLDIVSMEGYGCDVFLKLRSIEGTHRAWSLEYQEKIYIVISYSSHRMVKAVKGTLIECDPAAREVLLKLNSKDQFIIEDLDNTHLFINSTHLERVQLALDELMNSNTYEVGAPP